MTTAIMGIIAQLAAAILKGYLEKRAQDEKSAKDYLAFVEIMARMGLVSVDMRIRAQEQMNRVSDMWKEENENP